MAQGALAQLGERYAGSVEVTGSNPVCSTKSKEKVRLNGLTFSFDYVGYIYEHFWQNRLVMIKLHMDIIKLLLDVIMVTVYEEA